MTTTERPANLAEAAGLLREGRGSVVFRGGGTKLGWGGRPPDPELVLETAGLDRLLAHNPADMTVAVEAGLSLRALQDRLAAAGQWLALDPPTEAAGATIGGLLATGESGARRLRYGGLRDLVIGITIVLADGTVARAGGHVIKNVAGYDLSKLMYGSLGTLALVAEVVLRVHPRPDSSATVVVPASAQTAVARTIELLASPLEPAAADWVGGRLAVRFEGTRAGVEAQLAATRQLLGGGDRVVESDEAALWREFAAAHRAAPAQSTAFAGTLPSQLPALADALAAAGADAGVAVRLASHVALGQHTAAFAGPPDAQATAFDRWRHAVLALGGVVLLRDRPEEVDKAVDLFQAVGPPPPAVGLLRALKARLDPDGRLAPGRLGSWV
jgi:glycolate oxidase FAD binding subunit